MTWHILPVNDSDQHEELTTCKCFPAVEFVENGNMLVIHNSFDGREKFEINNNKPKIKTNA